MIVEVKVNELPESVADGTLVVWHKQPGDQVKADEPLAEIETDKVVLEIAAPSAGIVGPHLRKKGESVKRGDTITTIDATAAAAATKAESAPKKAAPKTTPATPPGKKAAALPTAPTVVLPPKPTSSVAAVAAVPATTSQGESDADGLAPAVRRLLDEHKLSASDVTGSGPRGRITKEDVLRHLEHSPQLASNIGEAPITVEISEAPASRSAAGVLAARPTTRTKMTRLRARIAERMLEAQRSAAILTTFNEINMQALMDLRRNYKDAFQTQHGVKLGIMGFFVKACAEALRRYPVVNASLDGDDIVYHGYFDIGVAVSTTRGLVVPVLRDADRMSLAEIERSIVGFGARGEEGKLGIDELTGGTFTISNGGVFGSMLSTPILNPPQSAILGLHRVQPRPVAEGDKVVIRPMMYLALSYDHRIIDGREAVLFLVAIKELIEDPTRFILKSVIMAQVFDLIVLGGGPAGYVAAIRAAQLGLGVACIDGGVGVDGKPSLGGTCLNVGCIPSKALLESSEHYHRCKAGLKDHGITTSDVRIDVPAMIARKNKIVRGLAAGVSTLFAKNKVVSFAGKGRLLPGLRIEISPLAGGPAETIEGKNILIATGSLPRDIDHVPTDGTIVVDSSGALDFAAAPEKLGVIGAGVIGLELGSVWHRLGSQVVLLEAMETFLPGADEQIADTTFKELSRQGLDIRLGARVLSAKVGKDGVQVTYENSEGKHSIEFSKLVVAVGRKPNTQGLDVNEVGLLLDERGNVHVDEFCKTNLPNIYAVGDVVRGPMLAHKASEEGIMVVERIAGEQTRVNYDVIPWVIYTSPEIAWVGKTERQLRAAARDYKVGVFPLSANGRARAMGHTVGLTKVLADKKSDRLLGVHIMAPMASEMIAEAVLAMEFGASAEDLQRTIHAHPSLAETTHEAALAADGRMLNFHG